MLRTGARAAVFALVAIIASGGCSNSDFPFPEDLSAEQWAARHWYSDTLHNTWCVPLWICSADPEVIDILATQALGGMGGKITSRLQLPKAQTGLYWPASLEALSAEWIIAHRWSVRTKAER